MVVLAMVLGVLVAWTAASVALALLTGGVIHERDAHDLRPVSRVRRSVSL